MDGVVIVVGLLALVVVFVLPALMVADEPRWAAALSVTTVAGAGGALVVFLLLALGPCDGDGGVEPAAHCGLLPLAFPVAPLVLVAAALGSYWSRRTWPIVLGLALAGALVAITASSIGGV